MRIALPCDNDQGLESEMSMHFGRAPHYAFVDVEGEGIKQVEVTPVPFSEHGPGDLPQFVKEHGGEVVIAYGMGRRAVDFFDQLGIRTVTGAQGRIKDVIEAFIRGDLYVDTGWKERGDFRHHGEH